MRWHKARNADLAEARVKTRVKIPIGDKIPKYLYRINWSIQTRDSADSTL